MTFKEYLLENQDKKNPLLITTSMPQYPTGYMYLDYGTGSYLTVCDDDEVPIYQYHNIGISQGSVNCILAKSQGGKTTLALGLGAAIIEPYVTSFLYLKAIQDVQRNAKKAPDIAKMLDIGKPLIHILDTEKTLPIDYAKKVARYTNKLTKAHLLINPITTDKDLMLAVEKHVRYKVENMQRIPMPMLDIFGNPVIDYPPTILIIDSASQLLLEDCDDPSAIKNSKNGIISIYESATQNTSGARRAKVIAALYSQLVNYAKKYNIIIFAINHINKMLPVNGVPVKQYRGLRAGETINGGEKAIYLTSNILRLDVIKAVGTDKPTMLNLGEGVTGHVAIASWIKSKSNSKSNSCQLVYTNQAGYDPLLSNLYYGKETGDLAKAGNFFYIPGYEDLKFTLKNYSEVFGSNPELFTGYYMNLKKRCEKLLDNPDNAVKHNQKMLEKLRDDIHEEYSDNKGDMQDLDDIFSQMINAA